MNTEEDATSSSPCRVLCLGDMGVDIFAQPLTRLPEPGELALTERIVFFPGGNALNTAVALQRLGERVRFIGSVGEDAFGDLLLSEVEKIGLDVRGVQRESGAATPTTLIYRAKGEDRRFLHALGAGDRFTGESLSPELIPEGGVLLVAGYLKLRAWNDDALMETLRSARERQCTTVLNVCIPHGSEVDPQRCVSLLPQVDVFLLNSDEARAIAGATEPELQALWLREAGVRVAIITRGDEGLYAEDGEQRVEMGAYSVPLVDPSGCGDCFSAGLIAALLREWDLVAALQFASAVGALGATALGCTSGVPSFVEVERFVQENGLDIETEGSLSKPNG